MGTIHEINHPYHPFGGPFMDPPISFFCGASILWSRHLWVIKKKSTRWGGSCRNSGHQLEIIHRNRRKTTKNKSSKTVSSKEKSKHQSNQSVNSFSVSFQKKQQTSDLLSCAVASGRVKAAPPLDVLARSRTKAEELLPLVAILGRWISSPVTGDFHGKLDGFCFDGWFESMDVFQWELGIFKGILNLDVVFFSMNPRNLHILHWD